MKSLITGVCGRIGTEVASQLKKEGHEVTGLDLVLPKNKIDGITYVQGELNNSKLLDDLLDNVDNIIHLAAHMSWSPQDNQLMSHHNIQGTFNLLNYAVNHKVSRFVFASSGEVYPEMAPQYMPIDEGHPLEPTSIYGETKKIGEELIRFFQQRFQLPSVILRFPHTQRADELLDPNSFFSGPRFFLQSKIKQMKLFNKPDMVKLLTKYDNGKLCHLLQCDETGQSYKMHISDVRDTAQGVLLAVTHANAIGEIFNLTTDEPVIFSEVLPLMQKITSCKIVKINLPGPAANYFTSNKKIKEKLGYAPQFSFSAMLEEAAIHWNNNNN